jgi:hypothetical protein
MKEEHKLQIRVRSKTEQHMMEDIDVKMIIFLLQLFFSATKSLLFYLPLQVLLFY